MSMRKRLVRPASLPLLPLRGLVIFPGVVLHFDVGRKKSVAALNEAMGMDQTIFLVAQKAIDDDDPALDALHEVGVVATVRQVLRLPGNNIRVVVEGLYRASVTEVLHTETFTMVASFLRIR
jgi:ATP-dependent Lon protease